jgi:hypothetical protein
MTIITTIGKSYAVTPTVDCIISTPDGATIATCPAGRQTIFVAPTVQIQISDDNALVTETFKGAPAGSSSGGGGSDYVLPAATATILGGVKICPGSGLGIDADGSAYVDSSRVPFLSAVNIFTGVNSFTGSVAVSSAPVSSTGVLRKVDLDVPPDASYTARTANLGWQLRWVKGAFSSALGGIYATSSTPAWLTDCTSRYNATRQPWRYQRVTAVLSKMPYKLFAPGETNNVEKGALCQFGSCYGFLDSALASTTPSNTARYDRCLVGPASLTAASSTAMCWPAATAGDGKIRVGFSDFWLKDGVASEDVLGRCPLFALAQPDWVQYIFYSPFYAAIGAKTQNRVNYLFARRADNSLVQIGASPFASAKINVSFDLVLSNLGDGIGDYKLLNGDVYGLESIRQFAANAGGQELDACWPVKRSLFKPSKEAQTLETSLTCSDTSLTVAACPSWVSVSQNGAAVSLALAANETGAERLGIVDMTLFNGITYSIIIYQQA